MSQPELFALLPIMVIAASAVVVMLATAFIPRPPLLNGLTLLGLLLTLVALLWVDERAPVQVTPLLMMDRFALFYSALVVLAGMVITLLSAGYFKAGKGDLPASPGVSGEQADSATRGGCPVGEYYILMLTALLGAMVLVASRHFTAFFMGLEILGVSLYVLVAYLAPLRRDRAASLEAGVKYLILSGVASALLLFGIALLYAEFGTLEFDLLGRIWAMPGVMDNLFVAVGLALLVSGVCFKLSLVPFHMWTPDVYEGAPVPVTAFVATVSKGAIFAFMLRFFIETGALAHQVMGVSLAVIATLSMLGGNLLALQQNNIKRMLAYSSVAHIGYLLVILLAGSNGQTSHALISEAVGFYLVAYFVTTLGAFAVVTVLSRASGERDVDQLNDYSGLFWRSPGLAITLTAMLLSLAGIPLTAGFIGKFYIFAVGIQAFMWGLLAVLVLGSVIGLYYYLRFIVVMFKREADTINPDILIRPVSPGDQLLLTGLLALLMWMGVYPDPIISFVQYAGLS